MAGGITVTHPDTTQYTGNVNRIVIVDGNGVQHEVQQVYWCADGTEAKLVWPGYVKYILYIYWDNDTSFAMEGVYFNNNLAGSVLTNAEHKQHKESWKPVDSTDLEGLRNGTANVNQHGYAIRLTFTTTTATNLGFNTNQYYHGNVSNVNIKVIGVDAFDNETTLQTYTDTITNAGTYRYAV